MGGGQSTDATAPSHDFQYDCDSEVAEFIRNKQEYLDELNSTIQTFASCQSVTLENNVGKVNLQSLQQISATSTSEAACRKKLEEYFQNFMSFVETINSSLRYSPSFNSLLNGHNLRCTVKYDPFTNAIRITGVKSDVKTMISRIRDAQKPLPAPTTLSSTSTTKPNLSITTSTLTSLQSNATTVPSSTIGNVSSAPPIVITSSFDSSTHTSPVVSPSSKNVFDSYQQLGEPSALTNEKHLSTSYLYEFPAVDVNLARFIKSSNTHSRSLADALASVADVELKSSKPNNTLQYHFHPVSGLKLSEEEFEYSCASLLEGFLKHYTSTKRYFKHEYLMKAVEIMPSYFKKTPSQNQEVVFVQWVLKQNFVLLCGLKHDVKSKKQEIVNFLNSIVPKTKLSYKFKMAPPDGVVVDFIRKSDKHAKLMQRAIHGTAKISFEGRGVCVEAVAELGDGDVQAYKERCTQVILSFLEQYSSWQQSYSYGGINHATAQHKEFFKEESEDVDLRIVRGSEIVLVGLNEDVSLKKANLNKIMKKFVKKSKRSSTSHDDQSNCGEALDNSSTTSQRQNLDSDIKPSKQTESFTYYQNVNSLPSQQEQSSSEKNIPDHMSYFPKKAYAPIFDFVIKNDYKNKELQSRCEGFCKIVGDSLPVKVVALHPEKFESHSEFTKEAVERIESFLDTIPQSQVPSYEEASLSSHQQRPSSSTSPLGTQSRDNQNGCEQKNPNACEEVYTSPQELNSDSTSSQQEHSSKITNKSTYLSYTPKKAYRQIFQAVIKNDEENISLQSSCEGLCTIVGDSIPVKVFPWQCEVIENHPQFIKDVITRIEKFLDTVSKSFIHDQEASTSFSSEDGKTFVSDPCNEANLPSDKNRDFDDFEKEHDGNGCSAKKLSSSQEEQSTEPKHVSYNPKKKYQEIFSSVLKNEDLRKALQAYCEGFCTITGEVAPFKVYPWQPELMESAPQFVKAVVNRIEGFLDVLMKAINRSSQFYISSPCVNDMKSVPMSNAESNNVFDDNAAAKDLRKQQQSFNTEESSEKSACAESSLPQEEEFANTYSMPYTPKKAYRPLLEVVLKSKYWSKKLQSWCAGHCKFTGDTIPVKVVPVHPEKFESHSEFTKEAVERIESFLDAIPQIQVASYEEASLSSHQQSRPSSSTSPLGTQSRNNKNSCEQENPNACEEVYTSPQERNSDSTSSQQEHSSKITNKPTYLSYTPKKAYRQIFQAVIKNDEEKISLQSSCEGLCTIVGDSIPVEVFPWQCEVIENHPQFIKDVITRIEKFLDTVSKSFIHDQEASTSFSSEDGKTFVSDPCTEANLPSDKNRDFDDFEKEHDGNGCSAKKLSSSQEEQSTEPKHVSYNPKKKYQEIFSSVLKNEDLRKALQAYCEGFCTITGEVAPFKVYPWQPELMESAPQFVKAVVNRIEGFLDVLMKAINRSSQFYISSPCVNDMKSVPMSNAESNNVFDDNAAAKDLRKQQQSFNTEESSEKSACAESSLPQEEEFANTYSMPYTPKKAYRPLLEVVLKSKYWSRKLQSWCAGLCKFTGHTIPVKVVPVHPENFESGAQFSQEAVKHIESFLNTVPTVVETTEQTSEPTVGPHCSTNQESSVSRHYDEDEVFDDDDDDGTCSVASVQINSLGGEKVKAKKKRKRKRKIKTEKLTKSEKPESESLQEEQSVKSEKVPPTKMSYTPMKSYQPMLLTVLNHSNLYKKLQSYCTGFFTITGTSFPLQMTPLNTEVFAPISLCNNWTVPAVGGQRQMKSLELGDRIKVFVDHSHFADEVINRIESFLDTMSEVLIPCEEDVCFIKEQREQWFSGVDSVVVDFKQDRLEIRGVPDDVEKCKKLVEEKLTVTTEQRSCGLEVCRVLVNCGVVDEVNKILLGKVKIICSIDKGVVSLTGKACYMDYAFQELATKGVLIEEAPSLPEEKLMIIKKLFSKNGKTAVEGFVNQKLQDDGVKAVLMLRNDEVILTAMTRNVFDSACKTVDRLIQSVKVGFPSGTPGNFAEKDDWKSLITTAFNSKLISFKIQAQSVEVTGIDGKSVKHASDRIRNYLKKFAFSDRFLVCKTHVVRYILKHCCKNNVDIPERVQIKEADKGVNINGPAFQVDKVVEYLRCKKWQRASLSYSCPNLASHFASDSWKGFFNLLESGVKCSISCDVGNPQQTKQEESERRKTFSSLRGDNGFNDEEDKTTKYGNVAVSVCHGDITNDNSDVIINGATRDFDLSRGTVSPALLRKAGHMMQHQCNSNPVMSSSVIRVTNGWNLLCDYVIHLVTPHDHDQLKSRLKDALDYADMLRKESVSLPTLGAGGIGLACDDVAHAMSEAFELFASETPSFVKHIKVVVYDVRIMDCFENAIVKSKEVMNFGKKEALAAERKAKLSLVEDHVTIQIVSEDAADLSEANGKIKAHMEERIEKKILKDDLISELDDHDCIDIYQAAVKHQVSVTFNNMSCEIILNGLSKNVSKLYDVIRELLFELRVAMTMSKLFDWKWASSSKQFTALPLRVGRAIEMVYEKNRGGTSQVNMYGGTLNLDFSAMTFTFNSISGELRRIDASAEKTPSDWTDMMGKTFLKVSLTRGSTEYDRVTKLFKTSYPSYSRIINIERIQHPSLYKQYLIKKSDVERHMISNHPVQRELFHGTSEDDADKICAEGFDRNFAGKNATAYGKGSYFAVNSNYSVKYAAPSISGTKYLFLARVLTGDFCKGHHDYKAPPSKLHSGDIVRLYDSVVDSETSPSIFVVFKDSSVYPYYLITFI